MFGTTGASTSVLLAAAAHPDPHFILSIFSPLDPAEATRLANEHGLLDETPLTSAIAVGHIAVADVLLRLDAKLEDEGSKPGSCFRVQMKWSTEVGLSRTPLGTRGRGGGGRRATAHLGAGPGRGPLY